VRAIAHIGISVPDLDAAVDWYCRVFGFERIRPELEVDLDAVIDAKVTAMCAEIFGERFRRMRVAHLATANGTALELFEFIEPPNEPGEVFAYRRSGIFHFSIVAADVVEQVRLIEASGGTRRSTIAPCFEGQPYEAAYCADPWGTVIEVQSHSHERMMSNQR
jgi:catechol 2,3-dioxygenase-like lactoylglutathione lyase family enzyme